MDYLWLLHLEISRPISGFIFMKLTPPLMEEIHPLDKEIMYMASDFLPLKLKVISWSLYSNPCLDPISLYTNQSEHAQWFGYASLSRNSCFQNGDLSVICREQSEVNYKNVTEGTISKVSFYGTFICSVWQFYFKKHLFFIIFKTDLFKEIWSPSNDPVKQRKT